MRKQKTYTSGHSIDLGGQAFPLHLGEEFEPGMSFLDYAAIHAPVPFVVASIDEVRTDSAEAVHRSIAVNTWLRYEWARAMLAERAKTSTGEGPGPASGGQENRRGDGSVAGANPASPCLLDELCELLGWQGGTIHQARAEVKRLIEADQCAKGRA